MKFLVYISVCLLYQWVFAFLYSNVELYDNALYQKEWALLLYLEGAEEFNNTAITIIKQCMQAASPRCAIAIVWHYSEQLTCLYVKHGNTLKSQKSFTHKDVSSLFIENIKWFFSQYPSSYHAVLIAGHGYGIAETNNRTVSILYYKNLIDSLKKALYKQKTKIDLLFLDACMMGSIEVLSPLNKSAIFCIASQASEPLAGINYTKLISYLNSCLTPLKICHKLVNNYQKYCLSKNPLGHYTLSAIDLSKIKALKKLLALLKNTLKELEHDPLLMVFLEIACSWSILSKSLPCYSDIKIFCTTLINLFEQQRHKQIQQNYYQIYALLMRINNTLDTIIVCSCANEGTQAQGLSFYNASFSRFG